MWTQLDRPSDSLQSSSGMLRCVLVVALTGSQVSASRTTFTETPLFEVCSAKVGPRHFVLHQHLSWFSRHHLRWSFHSDECRMHCHCHLETMGRLAFRPSILSASHLSDSGILLTFAERVLIAVPCSVTTTASDDEFSIPTNTPGWNRGSHFPPFAGLAGMYRIFSPTSRMGVLSLRAASAAASIRRCRCHTCSSGTQQNPPSSTVSLRRAGLWFLCDAPTQLSMFWPHRQQVLSQ